jgi:tetratricopeptide (TPR) repeat protein
MPYRQTYPKRLRISRLLLIIVFPMVAASNASAQRSSGSSEAAQNHARAAYARGQELYQEGKYEAAEAVFREAFEAVHNPLVLLRVAESQKKQGRALDAVTTLKAYLELRPEAPDREEVEQRISDMRASPATIAVASDPPGASVTIDGAGTGKVTPVEIDVTAGEHTVGLSLPGYIPFTQTLTVQYGTRHELQLALQAGPSEAPLPSSDVHLHGASYVPPEEGNLNGASVAPWVITGIGVFALGTGAMLGALAINEKSRFNKKPTHARALNGKHLTLSADVAFSVGAAFVITGMVLFLTAGDGNEETEGDLKTAGSERAVSLRVIPSLSPSYTGIATQLQF